MVASEWILLEASGRFLFYTSYSPFSLLFSNLLFFLLLYIITSLYSHQFHYFSLYLYLYLYLYNLIPLPLPLPLPSYPLPLPLLYLVASSICSCYSLLKIFLHNHILHLSSSSATIIIEKESDLSWIINKVTFIFYLLGPGTDVFSPRKYRGDHPAVHISWNDADAYCKWRNSRWSILVFHDLSWYHLIRSHLILFYFTLSYFL